ncbi:zonular occludens toxin domain-containing protein [Vibrio splendidus]
MIYLTTGTPGASKTLNTVKEICEDDIFEGRPIYYNNIKCLALDIDFLNSFSGYFYTDFLRNATDEEKAFVKPIINKVHREGQLVKKEDAAYLSGKYSMYNPIENFTYWVKKLYPEKRRMKYEMYLTGCEIFGNTPSIEEAKIFNLHWNKLEDPELWYECDFGSVIIIDEVQEYFPKRSASSKAPKHISELNTHRHKGFDLRFITQDSSLVDYQMKACINRHIHYKNISGGEKVSRLESGAHFNVHSMTERKAAEKQSVIKRDTKFYGSYYSAEIHTHKYRMPDIYKKLFWAIPVILLGAGLVVFSVNYFKSIITKHNPDFESNNTTIIIENNNEDIQSNNCVKLTSGRNYCI